MKELVNARIKLMNIETLTYNFSEMEHDHVELWLPIRKKMYSKYQALLPKQLRLTLYPKTPRTPCMSGCKSREKERGTHHSHNNSIFLYYQNYNIGNYCYEGKIHYHSSQHKKSCKLDNLHNYHKPPRNPSRGDRAWWGWTVGEHLLLFFTHTCKCVCVLWGGGGVKLSFLVSFYLYICRLCPHKKCNLRN